MMGWTHPDKIQLQSLKQLNEFTGSSAENTTNAVRGSSKQNQEKVREFNTGKAQFMEIVHEKYYAVCNTLHTYCDCKRRVQMWSLLMRYHR